jgi:hypothetical protein
MKAKVPEAIFKKAAVSSADAPPMLDMTAVQKAWFSCSLCSIPAAGGNLESSQVKIRVMWRNVTVQLVELVELDRINRTS